MSSPSPNTTTGTGDSGQQALTIGVAIAAGILVIIVLLLCVIVVYLNSRKDKIAEKKVIEVDNRHRLFREPTNISSRFDDIVDLEGIEQSSFFDGSDGSKRENKKKSRSAKKSIEVEKEATRNNPTFGKDDIYGDALELNTRGRKPRKENATEEQNGIANPAVDISDEQGPQSQGVGGTTPQGSPQPSGSAPASPTSPKLDILNPATWKKVEEGNNVTMDGYITGGDDELPTSDSGLPASDGGISSGDEVVTTESGESPPIDNGVGVFTISGTNPESRAKEIDLDNDGGEDEGANDDDDTYYMYSPFQRSSSQRRRSFQTRNSAVIDFYEGGSSLGRVRAMNTNTRSKEIDMETFWDGFKAPATSSDGPAQGLLWQNKRIF